MNDLYRKLSYETTVEQTRGRIQELLTSPNDCVFVACQEDQVVGWVHGFHSLRIESASFIEIGGLVVDANYRKNGIGKLLVTKVSEWSQQKKQTRLRVRSNVLRKDSHEFYTSIGFREIKDQKVFEMELIISCAPPGRK